MPLEPEKADQNGFYPSRKLALEQFLQMKPNGLLPCDQLQILGNYASMYQDVASYSAPAEVIERLNQIRASNPGWIVDDYNIENIEDASGTIVNCDFFPIQITTLPTNPYSNLAFTPLDFLEYFRTNINHFIPVDDGFDFTCLFDGFDDCGKWYSPYEQSLGALNEVRIPGPLGTFNDGSIIISDYQHQVFQDGHENDWFTVSTVETPFDGEHPVAGNRRFGIYNTPNNLNQWTFYTMGVDRTWDFYDGIFNSLFGGFEKADALWSFVQNKVIEYCNSNLGTAAFYSNHKNIARPKWDQVSKFLKKEISFQQLLVAMGC